ncbi:universal stress protein [Halobacteria archaeon AArc-dxtr1]|nr:universal stress protein [Halobacteria archaeon AArc-dxtr1]
MTTFVVGTDTPEASEHLCDYLEEVASDSDAVHVVHAQPSRDAKRIQTGRRALKTVEKRLEKRLSVETHEFQRGNDPSDEVLALADEVDADTIVIGLRRHSFTERIIGGSTGRSILMHTERPVVSVPVPT